MRNWAKFMNLEVFRKLRFEKGTIIETLDRDGSSNTSLPNTTTNGITAFAGGGQANAVPLTERMNRVTTVAVANDSVKLPPAIQGMEVVVVNAAAANSMNVFPSTGDAINALAANAAFAMAANKVGLFYCVNSGQWHCIYG